ncbi:MAG: hypothetical protein H6718_26715 [Polyangiaceae bacterium]|nr:hypothetical protein [Myxococcales bacterium]MCB9589034.1 hypothetical protein [Polyangiaceae bacterium]
MNPGSNEAPAAQTLFRLQGPGEHCSLRLFPDPMGRAKAFAHGAGFALETQTKVPAKLREALERLKSQLAALGEGLLPDLGPSVGLQLWHRWPTNFVPPRPWDGPRRRLLSAVAPKVPDLELLDCLDAASSRVLVKRELVTGDEADQAAREYGDAGLAVELATGRSGPGFVLFGAATSDVLKQAIAAEELLHRRDSIGDEATRAMGRLLGYPTCCIEQLVHSNRRDDFHAALNNIPPAPIGPFEASMAWLNPGVTALSHFPCTLACNASRAKGTRLLKLAEQKQPGLIERWLGFAKRIHAIDREGRYLALDADGPPERPTIRAAHAYAGGTFVPCAELHGLTLVPDAGGLVSLDENLHCILVSDNRAWSR